MPTLETLPRMGSCLPAFRKGTKICLGLCCWEANSGGEPWQGLYSVDVRFGTQLLTAVRFYVSLCF